MTSVSKTFFTVSSCTVAVTELMDFTWSYITDCLQNAKSLTVFEDFVVQVQGQGLVNWSSRILEDKDFPRGQQHPVMLPMFMPTSVRHVHFYCCFTQDKWQPTDDWCLSRLTEAVAHNRVGGGTCEFIAWRQRERKIVKTRHRTKSTIFHPETRRSIINLQSQILGRNP